MATFDDRRDKIQDLEKKIDSTVKSYKKANEAIAQTTDWGDKEDLEKENKRKLKEIVEMREEINYENKPAE